MDVGGSSHSPPGPLRVALSGSYRIEREIGRGGMAVVYLAQDLKHNRPVAIKVLRPELTTGITTARFLREIEFASRLTHPNLLPLHDSGQHDSYLYYVMPYVEGENLRQLIGRKRQLGLDEAVAIATDAAEALAYAHRQGVLHRDIKPENILMHEGRAIVADFGIARALSVSLSDGDGPNTSSGVVPGTATYMSPEQGSAERDLDERSDVYSLGCVVYEMLTGEPPFTGPTAQAVIARHVSERVPSLRIVRPNLPEAVEVVVNRALAKAPADRYQTVADFSAALLNSTTAIVVAPPPSRRPSIARVGTIALAVAVLAYAAMALLRGPLRQNDWVLVSDFDAPASDAQLGPVVRDLATQALKQSRFVRVFDRRQLNEVMRRASVPETTHVGARLARGLAERSSVRAVLQGAVSRLDSNSRQYNVVINLVRPDDGLPMATAVGTGELDALPTVVQGVIRQLREQVGERSSAIAATRPLRSVTTPSLEAFRKHTQALDAIVQRGDMAASNALWKDAIVLDSGFAAAWAGLGANYVSMRQPDSARWAFEHALALPDRLSVAEQYRLKGDVSYALDRDLAAAIRWYDLMLAEMPSSSSGHNNRALWRSALGDYRGALADLETALNLNPFGAQLVQPTLLNYGAILVVLGRLNDARRAADSLTGAPAGYLKTMIAVAAGDWRVADSVAASELAQPTVQGVFRINAVTSRAGALASLGKAADADSLLRNAAASARGSTARWYERARLLLAIAGGGDVPRRTDLVPSDTTPAATALRGLWAAVAGDTTAARAAVLRLGPISRAQQGTLGSTPAVTAGWLAGHNGRWRALIDSLAPLATRGEHDPTFLDRPDSYFLRWSVAHAYSKLGIKDSALAFVRLTMAPLNMPPGHFALRGLSHHYAQTMLR